MSLDKIFSYIEQHEDDFIDHLKRWVSIKSVSGDSEYRKDCFHMVDVASKELEQLGCTVQVKQNPLIHQSIGGVKLPPIIFAKFGDDSSKQTVCIYGHIDVQPAQKEDGWATEPFDLTMDGDRMFGRGSSDDKGPVLGWFCILQACKDLKIELGINLKFVIECMEESGSIGLEELLTQEQDFLSDIDYVCISDNYWLGTHKPCVTYGLRGIMYFYLEVSGPGQDLHSGVYGGTVREPLVDLIYLLSRLVDGKGTIQIPKIYDQVAELTKKQIDSYQKIDFDPSEYAKEIHCTDKHLLYKSKLDLLNHRWSSPTLSLHGIEGAFSQSGPKTVIPAKVIGKFSIRMVPDMVIEDTGAIVLDYITSLINELGSPNKIKLVPGHTAPSWVADVDTPNYKAAIKSVKRVYGVEPDLTREGGSIPVTLTFQQLTGKSVVLLPMGRGDDGAHSQNEKLNRSNYIQGIKLFAAYLHELSLFK